MDISHTGKLWKGLQKIDSKFIVKQWLALFYNGDRKRVRFETYWHNATTALRHTFELFKVMAPDQLRTPRFRMDGRMQCSFKFPAVIRQNSVNGLLAGKKAVKHVTSRPRILRKARQCLITSFGNHMSFLVFITSGIPTRFMKLI